MKTIETKSGKMPYDIEVTRSGDLVYTEMGSSFVLLKSVFYANQLVYV